MISSRNLAAPASGLRRAHRPCVGARPRSVVDRETFPLSWNRGGAGPSISTARRLRYEAAVDQSLSFTGRDSAFYASRKVEAPEQIVPPDIGPTPRPLRSRCWLWDGNDDQFLCPRVASLHGIDISEEMLTKARSNVPKAEYRWYDGDKVPFPDETFDTWCSHLRAPSCPSLETLSKFVSEMVRVTRSGGLVAIFEHNPFNPLTRHAVNSCAFSIGTPFSSNPRRPSSF